MAKKFRKPKKKEKLYLDKQEINSLPEKQYLHPLNPKAERFFRTLSDVVGLKKLGLHLVRVKPGKESTELHAHYYEEEFIYVLSGEGRCFFDHQEVAISEGSFIGFPPRGPTHKLKNTGKQDLIYLLGGERRQIELIDYPQQKKKLLKVNGKKIYF